MRNIDIAKACFYAFWKYLWESIKDLFRRKENDYNE